MRRGRIKNNFSGVVNVINQLKWKQPFNSDQFVEPLNESQIYSIDDAAMRVLEEIGIEFLNDEAKDYLQKAGCKVNHNSNNVKMCREWVKEMISFAPKEFTIFPRNEEKSVKIGGRNLAFVNVSSPPNVLDLDRGRRVGNQDSFRDFIKLTQYFNCIHLAGGYPVEPVDIHPSIRHLECLYDKLILTDKVCHAYSLGKERVEDCLEMTRIASGLNETTFYSKPRIYTNINSSSPLKHDYPMLDGAMRFARKGQPVIVTPFTLAGAMAPVTIVGAVVQSIAEGLAAIALLQWINKGTPCVLGTFTSNVDMKSGSPAFGTPEYVRATQMSGQMSRFYGLPLRASNACAANAPDAQAMYESLNSMWSAINSGVNVVYHSAGWLEGGLIASYEKFVIDCEVLQNFQRYFEKELVETSDETIAFDAIKEVGPDGNFFAAEHTQSRYKDAFYRPFLSDWRNYEAWKSDGEIWTHTRANKIWKKILDEFEPPEISSEKNEELLEFVNRRKKEGGAPTDF